MIDVDITTLIIAIVSIASIVFGTKWVKAKKILKEFSDIPLKASEILEDDTVTKEELLDFVQEVSEFIDAVKS